MMQDLGDADPQVGQLDPAEVDDEKWSGNLWAIMQDQAIYDDNGT